MEKYDNLNVNDDLWSLAWAIEFGEQRDRVIKEDMFEEGMEKGMKKGMKKGIEKGMQTIIHQMIHSRYRIDAHDWIETLTEEDLSKISHLLFTCDTFDELKSKLCTH